jgi:hypothetical protein
VSAGRRVVRVVQGFLDELDLQLAPDRGPDGAPSAADFLSIEIPDIVEEFASNFDRLPIPVPDRPDYRILIGAGKVVRAYAVIGQLRPDGEVELLALSIDL